MEILKKINELKYFYGNPSIFFNSGKLIFDEYCETKEIAIISIPNDMEIQEIIDLINGKFFDSIKKLKVVKTEIPKYYTIILNFEDENASNLFYDTFNNKKIDIFEDNFLILKKISKNIINISELENLIDNDKCTICLESYKKEKLPLMILCGHMFHYVCIKKWNEETCPLCRYEQHPLYLFYCDKCNSCENIWMCIICGFLGCGGEIPMEGHISQHSLETNHIFSKLINNNLIKNPKIFDHSIKDFIDRLFINSENGIIGIKSDKKEEKSKKINIDFEDYNEILTYNLEKQRNKYKNKINKIKNKNDIKRQTLDNSIILINKDINIIKENIINKNKIINEQIENINKEKNEKSVIDEECLVIKNENKKLSEDYKKLNKINDLVDEENEIKKEIKNLVDEIKDLESHINNSKLVKKTNSQGSNLYIL